MTARVTRRSFGLWGLCLALPLFACEPVGDPPHVAAAGTLGASACPRAFGERAVVIAGALVFDGVSAKVADVRFAQGKIETVGADADRCNADVIDGSGKTLLPGLIDAHTHAYEGKALAQAAAFGVTTEIEMFGDPARGHKQRLAEARGERQKEAAIVSAGILATAPGGHGTEYGFSIPTLERPEEADAFVTARLAEGSDFLKVVIDDGSWFRGHPVPTLDAATVAAIVRVAHGRERLVVAHIGTRKDAEAALGAGVDGLAHLFVDSPADDAFIASAAAHRAFVIPTLGVLAVAVGDAETATWAEQEVAFTGKLDAADLAHLHARFALSPPGAKLAYAEDAVRRLKATHVPLLAGTDALNPGVIHGASLHRELELLVRAGLTASEALASATSSPAACFHLEDRGRIAPLLRADLLLVEGDATRDVRQTRRIAGVWRGGAPIDREAYFARARPQP